jgi:hypothetical protein
MKDLYRSIAAEYEAIDLECEALTEQESEVGTLVVLRD